MKTKLISAVGSIALDWLELPNGLNGDTLGGSLTYFTRSAGVLAPVSVIGVIGSDFPEAGISLFKNYAKNIDDLQINNGPSFRWGGKYHDNWEDRTTLYTELGVFEDFSPEMSEINRKSPLLYLGNIHPALQLDVRYTMANWKNKKSRKSHKGWYYYNNFIILEFVMDFSFYCKNMVFSWECNNTRITYSICSNILD